MGNKILGEILGMSRGMLNRKIEVHIKANPFKSPWGLFEGGSSIEKYFISTRCKKFDLTPMGCYSRAGAYMQLENFIWAYGVVVSTFDFHRSDRGSNPDRGGKIL